MKKKVFIIIDGNSVAHRAYHALPHFTNKKGETVGAIYGFILAFFKAIKDFQPDYLAICFDRAEPTFRHAEFKEYKAKRIPTPQELAIQLQKIREILKKLDIAVFEKSGFEADDLIATVINRTRKTSTGESLEIYVLTGDHDSLQLVNSKTKMYILNRGVKNSFIYDREKIIETFGVEPSQIVALKSLAGDPSDNISGIGGIGKKIAQRLLQKYGTLENLYAVIEKNESAVLFDSRAISNKVKDLLLKNKEKVFFFKKIVQMRDDVTIDFNLDKCRFIDLNKEKTETTLTNLNFISLLKRVPQKKGPKLQTLF